MGHESKSRKLLTECHSTTELDLPAAKLTARYYRRHRGSSPAKKSVPKTPRVAKRLLHRPQIMAPDHSADPSAAGTMKQSPTDDDTRFC